MSLNLTASDQERNYIIIIDKYIFINREPHQSNMYICISYTVLHLGNRLSDWSDWITWFHDMAVSNTSPLNGALEFRNVSF